MQLSISIAESEEHLSTSKIECHASDFGAILRLFRKAVSVYMLAQQLYSDVQVHFRNHRRATSFRATVSIYILLPFFVSKIEEFL